MVLDLGFLNKAAQVVCVPLKTLAFVLKKGPGEESNSGVNKGKLIPLL